MGEIITDKAKAKGNKSNSKNRYNSWLFILTTFPRCWIQCPKRAVL